MWIVKQKIENKRNLFLKNHLVSNSQPERPLQKPQDLPSLPLHNDLFLDTFHYVFKLATLL